MAFVKEEGYELSEDELEEIAGGYCGSLLDCTSNDSTKPYCNSYTIS